jgi:drug/metabolite transporter (DMT)-like permease
MGESLGNGSQLPATKISIWIGMLIIYVVWSSTYLAIRFAVESFPPFIMAAARFLIAGIILYGFRRIKGDAPPRRLEWRSTAIIGLFLLLGGNGGVSWAEQRVVSSIAALLVGSTPLWIVLVDAIRPNGKKPGWLAFAGVILGFVGIAILIDPWGNNLGDNSITIDGWGIAALLLASLSWAIGSVFSRQAEIPASPLLATGMEMIAGGIGLLVVGTVLGEWQQLRLEEISIRSWWSLAYLIIFGSLMGFATYTWLLRVAPISLVSTYAYVNPLVAIFLGNVLAQEPLTTQLVISAVVIIGSVIIITTANIRQSIRNRRI